MAGKKKDRTSETTWDLAKFLLEKFECPTCYSASCSWDYAPNKDLWYDDAEEVLNHIEKFYT